MDGVSMNETVGLTGIFTEANNALRAIALAIGRN